MRGTDGGRRFLDTFGVIIFDWLRVFLFSFCFWVFEEYFYTLLLLLCPFFALLRSTTPFDALFFLSLLLLLVGLRLRYQISLACTPSGGLPTCSLVQLLFSTPLILLIDTFPRPRCQMSSSITAAGHCITPSSLHLALLSGDKTFAAASYTLI